MRKTTGSVRVVVPACARRWCWPAGYGERAKPPTCAVRRSNGDGRRGREICADSRKSPVACRAAGGRRRVGEAGVVRSRGLVRSWRRGLQPGVLHSCTPALQPPGAHTHRQAATDQKRTTQRFQPPVGPSLGCAPGQLFFFSYSRLKILLRPGPWPWLPGAQLRPCVH